MAKFDLDDPLGDLLSDGSDDSFFENPKAPARRASAAGKSPEKKSVTDLFGLDDRPKSSAAAAGGDAKKPPSPASSTRRRRERPVKKISFEDDDPDILNTLGLETNTKQLDHSQKKASLMESILGAPKDRGEDKKFVSLDDLLKDSKAMKKPVMMPVEVTQSATQLTEPKLTNSTTLGFGLDVGREGRRARPRSTTVADPLGLFDAKPTEEPKQRRSLQKSDSTEIILAPAVKEHKSKSDSNLADVPNWLGGTQIKQTEEIPHQVPTIASDIYIPLAANQSMDNLVTQQKLATSHMEYQNASVALQQQESQLLMALQLRKYEDNMSDMQRKQQEVLVKQEQQFNTLLERQFAKQHLLENNMRLQQERINGHIQMLIAQPPITSAVSTEELEKIGALKKTNADELTKQYEDMIVHLKQRQHEEVFLLEESYKKQISTLEQSMESVENHLKMELDALVTKNRDKIEVIEEEHKRELEKYKKKIDDLHLLHDNEMKQMRENNNRVVDEIKYEYNTIIENLKMSKTTEHTLLLDARSYTDRLDASLKLLDVNSRSLMDIREKVHGEYDVLSAAREEGIKAKQNEIELMRAALEKAREAADQERAQLMALVRNLEVKLAEQNQNAREERFALQQAAATLAARTSALDREADFNRQSLDREREQLNVLRETILAEQSKSMQEMADEKLKLHAEKVRLETSAKLHQDYDAQRAKAEVEAAVRVAKDAAELTDRERENLLLQQHETETLKRTLIDKESRLKHRERELDIALEHANRKNMLGEKALDDARMLQINYNEKLREIQAQVASLNNREKKLAEDKISISKERLALHNNARQIRRCGLCAVENHGLANEDDASSEPVEHDLPQFISVSDADMFRLQLQMSEDQLSTADECNNVRASLIPNWNLYPEKLNKSSGF